MHSLAQRRHSVTLVDRAVQEDGISLNRAAENLQVSGRWHAALQDLQDITNPQGRDILRRPLKISSTPTLTVHHLGAKKSTAIHGEEYGVSISAL